VLQRSTIFIAEQRYGYSAPAERHVVFASPNYIPLLTEREKLDVPGYKHFAPPEREPQNNKKHL